LLFVNSKNIKLFKNAQKPPNIPKKMNVTKKGFKK